jgi:hypothetical protein
VDQPRISDPTPSRIGDGYQGEIQRVGGRRRIRPEIILPIAGALFLAAALVKPWPNPPIGPQPVAASPSSPTRPPAGQTADPLADVQIGVPGQLSKGWAEVDWSVLGLPDMHRDWGFAAVAMPNLTGSTLLTGVPAPATDWTAIDTTRQATTVTVTQGHSVFALALTWPLGTLVSSVTFVYLGGPENPPDLPPAGFPAFTQVSPLPADGVAPPNAGFDADPDMIPPTKPMGNSAINIIHSGTYWIPPSEASFQPTTGSIETAWRTLPWPWPNGVYRVTIVSAGQTTTIRLNLQRAA